MKNNFYLEKMCSLVVVFSTLIFGISFFAVLTNAQQDEDDKQSEKQIVAITEDKEEFLLFDVVVKERYYVGEPLIFSFKFTNTSGTQEVLEAEHRKYSLRAEGIFNNGGEVQVKEFEYEGSFEVLPTEKDTKKVLFTGFESPKRKEPTYVMLNSNEKTSVEQNLSNRFFSELFHPGKYKLVAKSEGGQLAVAEFEIYFDEEKSTLILEKKLREDGTGFYLLSQYNRIKLITVLEEMQQSDKKGFRDKVSYFYDALRTMDEHNSKKVNQ